MTKFYSLLLGVLFVLQNVFPTILQPIKIFILILIIISYFCLLRQVTFKIKTIIPSLLYAFFGFSWAFYGVYLDNPGALPLLTVMFVYPLLYILPITLSFSFTVNNILKTIRFTGWVVALSQAFFIISYFSIDNQIFYNYMISLYGDYAVIDSGAESLAFTLPNVASLLFIVPFFLVLILFSQEKVKSDIVLLFIMLLIVLASGRRVFFLLIPLSFVFSYIVAIYRGVITRKNFNDITLFFILSTFIFFCGALLKYDFTYFIELFYSIFDFTSNTDNLERLYQINGLMEGFYSHPLFGSGAGAVSSYIRSYEKPWSYELFYLSFLFQFGLLGIIIYGFGLLYIFHLLIKVLHPKNEANVNSFSLALLAGLFGFLLANGTNPYLAKFDYVWVVFLPYIFCLNYFSLKECKV